MDGVSISGMTGLGIQTSTAGSVNQTSANSTDGRAAAVRTGGLQETGISKTPDSGIPKTQTPVRTEESAPKTPDPAAVRAAETAREAMTGRDIIATDTDGDTLAVTKASEEADGNVTKTRDTGTDDSRQQKLSGSRMKRLQQRKGQMRQKSAQRRQLYRQIRAKLLPSRVLRISSFRPIT